MFRRGSQRHSTRYRIYFATDVHGSDRCFRKFLSAAQVYNADALVLGGDIAGKGLVPLIQRDHSYSASFQGERAELSAAGVLEWEERIRFNGLYPVRVTPDEDRRLAEDYEYRRRMFHDVITSQITTWANLATRRLPSRIRLIITPGNDDPPEIDACLLANPRIECPERQTIPLGPTWLASLGDTNRTPWDTDREYDEEVLASRIASMLNGFDDGRPLLFNFHCPPYASGLDVAAQLDEHLRPVVRHGSVQEIPVGSTAVHDAIQRYQPQVALHGHIHEAAGVTRIGTAICINPGSEYSSGILKGCIVDLDAAGRYVNHLLTTG